MDKAALRHWARFCWGSPWPSWRLWAAAAAMAAAGTLAGCAAAEGPTSLQSASQDAVASPGTGADAAGSADALSGPDTLPSTAPETIADATADADTSADTAPDTAADVASSDAAQPDAPADADTSADTAPDTADAAASGDAAQPDGAVDTAPEADTNADTNADADGAAAADAAPSDAAYAETASVDAAAEPDSDASADAADATPLPTPATAVVWTGGFVNQAPELSFLLSLPLGPTKPLAAGQWEPLTLGLLDDLNGDGAADLVVANQAGALAVAHGPLSATTKLQVVAAAGKTAIHSLAVLHRHGQPPLVLTGSAPIGAWQAQGQAWVQVGAATALNLPGKGLRHGLSMVDLDSDGLLDVLVSDFSCEKPGGHTVLVDRGDGVFTASPAFDFEGVGAQWASVAGDWDGDGDLDLAWLHDGCGNPKTTQGFFRQLPRGPDGWPVYQRQQPHSLFAFPQAPVPYASPMGGATLDVFNTAKPGLALANTGMQMPLETAKAFLLGVDEADIYNVQNNLLLGQPDGTLLDVAGPAGLKALAATPGGLDMQAWAILPLDVDGDGWQDLLVAHASEPLGSSFGIPGPTRPVLLRNQGFGKFLEISQMVGLPSPITAPVLTTGDLDGDGDTDALLGQTGGPLVPLINQTSSNGKRLRLRLRGHTSNPAAIGARVTAQTAVGPVSRWVGLDAPYATHADPQVELGIGAAAGAPVTIVWPSGYVQQLGVVPAGTVAVIDEPALLELSGRRVTQGKEIEVVLTPRDPTGGLMAVQATATLVQNSPAFLWKVPLTCGAGGCKGVLVANAVFSPATAFLKVSWPGTELKVWPRLTAVP